jgi:hypothetical protein
MMKWKDAYFKVLSQHLPSDTQETHKYLLPGWCVSGPKSMPRSHEYEVSVNHPTMTFSGGQ